MRAILPWRSPRASPPAAGSGGSGNGGTGGDGSAIVRHAEQARALDAAAARLGDLDFTATLPASGTASYAGHLGATAVFAGAPVFVTADVALTARFGAGSISGTFSDASAADGSVTGSGRFDNGTLGPAGIAADVTGTARALRRGAHGRCGMRGAFLGAGRRVSWARSRAGSSAAARKPAASTGKSGPNDNNPRAPSSSS
jgi:hypothetical protein